MKFGIMNFPKNNLIEELKNFNQENFDYLDLTLDPPEAEPEKINEKKLLKIWSNNLYGNLGHTSALLPWHSPIEDLRKAAVKRIKKYLSLFNKLKINYVTIHLNPRMPGYINKQEIIIACSKSLEEILPFAQKKLIKLMLENCGNNNLDTVNDFKKIMSLFPELLFNLDVAHTNLVGSKSCLLLIESFYKKLVHVHLSDNFGDKDEHLPIGAGNINWKEIVRLLKIIKYNKTFTLEIFSSNSKYLLYSKEYFLKLWKENN